MATTDTRTGFRLPWSSDRSNSDAAREPEVKDSAQTSEVPVEDQAQPAADFLADPVASSTPDPESPEPPSLEGPSQMIDLGTSVAKAPATPRKPSKLVADLSAAIRSTAEAARDQALSQLEAEVKQVVESIREQATEGSAVLRQRSERDVAAIRDWSKAEVARIREETDARISARKTGLEGELARYAAAVDDRIEEVQAEVARFQTSMDTYFARLQDEDDPAQLATMAERMPEPPSFAMSTEVDPAEIVDAYAPPVPELTGDPEPPVEAYAEPKAERQVEVAAEPVVESYAEPVVEAEPVGAEVEPVAEPVGAEVEPVAEPVVAAEVEPVTEVEPVAGVETLVAVEPAAEAATEPLVEPPAVPTVAAAGDESPSWIRSAPVWGESDMAWGAAPSPIEPDSGDRGALLTALDAEAQTAVGTATSDETADHDDAMQDLDPDAAAAIGARLQAVGFGSLSSAIRPADEGNGDAAEPLTRTTQVVVSGLISVASIASFKRHLGRLPGVRSVTVASGPEGEFMFNVSHTDEVPFRDSIPTMPGFAARVTGATDEVVSVVARDPDNEG